MKKVFVALSGGVDSAVTAHILKKQGFIVTGIFIRVWQPDFLSCSQDEEEKAAKRVAANLGIEFRRLDLSKEYKAEVVDKMIHEYKLGRTPNPDVLCNAEIKFGAFLKYAIESGVNKMATGHHAQIFPNSPPRAIWEDEGINEQYTLIRGKDKNKDQSYFLWKLTQEQLSKTIMPIGSMLKDDVRKYAKKNNIPSAYKPDSQGLCFIGHINMKDFLSNFIIAKKGTVLNENGDIIGSHNGSEFITIGQRSGFELNDKNVNRNVYYVVNKNVENNTITVSETRLSQKHASKVYRLTDTNWRTSPKESKRYTCEIRYHGEALACNINEDNKVIFDEPQLVANGQSIVVYDKNICIGGGIVS